MKNRGNKIIFVGMLAIAAIFSSLHRTCGLCCRRKRSACDDPIGLAQVAGHLRARWPEDRGWGEFHRSHPRDRCLLCQAECRGDRELPPSRQRLGAGIAAAPGLPARRRRLTALRAALPRQRYRHPRPRIRALA